MIGAVLVAGAKAPHLVSEEMVKKMGKGSVIVDVADSLEIPYTDAKTLLD